MLLLLGKLDWEILFRFVCIFHRFLADLGVEHDKICRILSHVPEILEETEVNLKARVSYLVSNSSQAMI